MRFIGVFFTIALFMVTSVCASRDEDRLLGDLLVGYQRLSRPVLRDSLAVKMKFGVSLREAVDLNEELGQVTVLLWLRMVWVDQYLRWSPEKYGGIKQIYVTHDRIWTPDITMYNALHTQPEDVDTQMKLVVRSDGEVSWLRPVTYSSTCKHEFRGNAWHCPLTFGSWVYHNQHLDIKSDSKKVDIDTDDFLSSNHFALLGHEGKREVRTYKCCREPYVSFSYIIQLRNKIGPALLGRK